MGTKPYCGCPPKKAVPCVLTPTECDPESIEPVGLYSGYEGGYDEGGVYALNQVVYFDGGLYLSLRACNRARPVKGMTTSEFFYYGATEGVDVSGFVTSVTSNPDNDKELLVVAGGQTTVVTLPTTNNIKSVANLDGDIVWFTAEDGTRTPVDFSKYRNNPAVNVADKHTHFESLDETIQKGVDSNGHPTEYYTPLQVGDTVTIDGCTYENMVKDNQGRPSKLSVFKGEWIDYCQLNTLLHCMFPAHIEQVEGCGDCTESEKLVEETPLCDRVTTLEDASDKSLSTVNTVDGVTTLTMTDGTEFTIPASVLDSFNYDSATKEYVLTNVDGTELRVVNIDKHVETVNRNDNDSITLHMSEGSDIVVPKHYTFYAEDYRPSDNGSDPVPAEKATKPMPDTYVRVERDGTYKVTMQARLQVPSDAITNNVAGTMNLHLGLSIEDVGITNLISSDSKQVDPNGRVEVFNHTSFIKQGVAGQRFGILYFTNWSGMDVSYLNLINRDIKITVEYLGE